MIKFEASTNNNNNTIKPDANFLGGNSFGYALTQGDMNAATTPNPAALAGSAIQIPHCTTNPVQSNALDSLSLLHSAAQRASLSSSQQLHNPNSASPSSGASPTIPKISPEYLQELLKDKRNLQNFPNVFHHVDKILETEITRVRGHLFHIGGTTKVNEDLPDPEGTVVTVQEKVFIPVTDNPNYNFVGRILGPRGMTAKQLETDLGCKIMIRGKGSMRDKKKEDQNRGKPNWEHLSDELHVLICVEDYQNRAELKAKRAAEEIKKFLEEAVKMNDSEDKLKQMQLMELALMNEANKSAAAPMVQQSLALAAAAAAPHQLFRLPGQAAAAGSPLLLAGAPRLPQAHGGAAAALPGQHILSPSDHHHLLNYPIVSAADYNYLLAQGLIGADPAAAAAAYSFANATGFELSQAGPMKARLSAANTSNLRAHPYSRVPGL